MKKKSESRIVKIISRIFNVRVWFDWERMKAFTAFVGSGFSRLFSLAQDAPGIKMKDDEQERDASHTKAFIKTQHKLHLSDQDLLVRERALLRLSIFMSFLMLCCLGYTLYHLFQASFQATFLSLVVTFLAGSLAFRYHFWYYQIKNRRLGCSISEWFKRGLLGEKK